MIFFFIYLPNKMGENKYCRNCSKIQLKNRKRGKLITITHKYMTALFPGLVQALQCISRNKNKNVDI